MSRSDSDARQGEARTERGHGPSLLLGHSRHAKVHGRGFGHDPGEESAGDTSLTQGRSHRPGAACGPSIRNGHTPFSFTNTREDTGSIQSGARSAASRRRHANQRPPPRWARVFPATRTRSNSSSRIENSGYLFDVIDVHSSATVGIAGPAPTKRIAQVELGGDARRKIELYGSEPGRLRSAFCRVEASGSGARSRACR